MFDCGYEFLCVFFCEILYGCVVFILLSVVIVVVCIVVVL